VASLVDEYHREIGEFLISMHMREEEHARTLNSHNHRSDTMTCYIVEMLSYHDHECDSKTSGSTSTERI
jgi:hypothetical protein